jgi:serine-type D-Ala-D-Ala carboxypeptidase/endopeptidase (penicillin-binding protein 4)
LPSFAIATAALLLAASPHAGLRAALEKAASSPALAGARVGMLVKSLDTGEVIFSRSPDDLLNPASNVKLFTAAAALGRLGPEYRFETEFLTAPGANGARTLYVRGKGDPTFVAERLWAVAGELAGLGLTKVADVVVDDSFFDGVREGPGFDQEEGDRAYLAPAGAVSLDFNTVAVRISPGAKVGAPALVRTEPPGDFVEVENRAVTADPRAKRRVKVSSRPGSNGHQRVVVTGQVPAGGRSQVLWRRVDDPPLHFGSTLRRLLEQRGVKMAGQVRRGPVPDGAALLLVSESEPLSLVVRRLQKHSNNFVAEQILKTLGAEARGAPGSWPKGVAAVEDFLAAAGIPRGSYLMRNGSGLNDANRFSARQTVKLLEEMWRRFPLASEFVSALPVAGRDGTIRWRMEGTAAAGRLRAKTGTLQGVTSLCGYVESAGGERLAFAVLVNDHNGRVQTVRAVDELGALLAAGDAPPRPPALAVAVAADDGIDARIASYYRLGRATDARNLAFLRSAARLEEDPAVRLAAAEAVYLSDPDGDGARRVFLDAVTPSPAVLARLRAAAGTPPEWPVVTSLSDLAAEGVTEAILRLADLSAAGMESELAGVWGEVAASAPEETAAALLEAPEASARAAARSLALSTGGSAPGRVAVAALLSKEGGAGGPGARRAAEIGDLLRTPVAAPLP